MEVAGSSQVRKLANSNRMRSLESQHRVIFHGLNLQRSGDNQICSRIFWRQTRASRGKICRSDATPTNQASHLRGVMEATVRVNRFSKALAGVRKRMLASMKMSIIQLITGRRMHNCKEIMSRANTTLRSIILLESKKCPTLSRSPKIKSACSSWVKP